MTAAGARRGETGEWTARAHRGTFPGARRSLSGDEKAAGAVTPTAGRRLATEDPRMRCPGPVPAARAAEAKRARGFPEPAAGERVGPAEQASSERGEALPGSMEQRAPGPRRWERDQRGDTLGETGKESVAHRWGYLGEWRGPSGEERAAGTGIPKAGRRRAREVSCSIKRDKWEACAAA